MIEGPRILLTFDSIHDVIRAEKILLKTGIACELVPTPRHISSDCGMSVECAEVDLPCLELLQSAGTLAWRGRYTAL